jgi:hypothetical protein
MAKRKTKTAQKSDHARQLEEALTAVLNLHTPPEEKTLRMTFNEQAQAVKKTVAFCQAWVDASRIKNGAASASDDDTYQKFKVKADRHYKLFRDAAETIAEVKVTKRSPRDFQVLSQAVDNLHGDYSKDALWNQLKPAVMALK